MTQTANYDSREYIYRAIELARVITASEICLLWGKTPSSVKLAYLMGYIEGRKALTGGTWLYTVSSVTAHWGEPKIDLLNQLQRENENG